MTDHKNWSEFDDTYWTPEEHVIAFYDNTLTLARVKTAGWAKRNPDLTTIGAMESIALEALLTASRAWHEWAEGHDGAANSKTKFWAYARTTIVRRLMDEQRRLIGRNESQRAMRVAHESIEHLEDGQVSPARAAAWARQLMRLHSDHSLLPAQLVEAIATLTEDEQLILAMNVIDDIDLRDITTILGLKYSDTTVPNVMHSAALRLRVMATNLTRMDEDEVDIPEPTHAPLTEHRTAIRRWVRATHGMTENEWLAQCRADYLEDPDSVAAIFVHVNEVEARRAGSARAAATKAAKKAAALSKNEVELVA
jgi:hypothetical protein